MLGLGLLMGAFLLLAYGFACLHGRRLVCELVVPRHLEAASPFAYRLCISNHARFLDAWRLRVEVKATGELLSEKTIHWLPARGGNALDLEGEVAQRGKQEEWKVELHSTTPFGLIQSVYQTAVSVDLLVRPHPMWIWKPSQPGQQGVHHGDRSWTEGWSSDGEPRGLRPWHTGDKARSIVWPASLRSMAQGSSWLVRDVDPPGNGLAEYTVLFHSYGGGVSLIRRWSFEEAIGHVAGVVKYLLVNGLCVSILADFLEWKTWECRSLNEFGECQDMLALVERSTATEFHEVREVMESIPEANGVIVLSDFPSEVWQENLALPKERVWVRPEKRINRLRMMASP